MPDFTSGLLYYNPVFENDIGVPHDLSRLEPPSPESLQEQVDECIAVCENLRLNLMRALEVLQMDYKL